MSILDDAIREHLELKRAHGADESELKKLEDEAFGPPGRPEEGDSLAEARTEFLSAAEAPEGEGRREPNIADLQEPPPPDQAAPEEIPEQEKPEPAPEPAAEAPAVEEQPAMEHQAVPEAPEAPDAPEEPEPVVESGPNTEERHAIADQPTEFFDVEAEMGSEEVGVPPEAEATARPEAPPPPAEPEPAAELEDEEDEEFWGEQRLSDELDRALDAPLSEEEELEEDEEIEGSEGAGETGDEGEPEGENVYDPDTGHDDVLEDTPEFLEDAPEDDDLWFEQRPPKDFDFDD